MLSFFFWCLFNTFYCSHMESDLMHFIGYQWNLTTLNWIKYEYMNVIEYKDMSCENACYDSCIIFQQLNIKAWMALNIKKWTWECKIHIYVFIVQSLIQFMVIIFNHKGKMQWNNLVFRIVFIKIISFFISTNRFIANVVRRG